MLRVKNDPQLTLLDTLLPPELLELSLELAAVDALLDDERFLAPFVERLQEPHYPLAAKYFPDHIIAGNVDPRLMAKGKPDEIYEACRKAIEKGKQYYKSGYVLMGGCEIPPNTPPYHI